MKRFFILTLISIVLCGCSSSVPSLQENGYMSTGNKYFYCENKNIFDDSLINELNDKYFSNSSLKIQAISDVKSPDGMDYQVQSPLSCTGVLAMNDGSDYDFSIKASIPKKNTRNIDLFSYAKNEKITKQKREDFLAAFNSENVQSCYNLMQKLREQYGRAPICLPATDRFGKRFDSRTNLVALSDSFTSSRTYFYIQINPGSIPGVYSYDEHELGQLITMIQYQGFGITNNQAQIKTMEFIIDTLDTYLADGDISQSQHDSMKANLMATISKLKGG